MQARTLSETVSLSSGLGLTEIWSAFFTSELPSLVKIQVDDMEKMSCSLRQNADSSRKIVFWVQHTIELSFSSTAVV